MKSIDDALLQLARGENAVAPATPSRRPKAAVEVDAAPARRDPRREED